MTYGVTRKNESKAISPRFTRWPWAVIFMLNYYYFIIRRVFTMFNQADAMKFGQ